MKEYLKPEAQGPECVWRNDEDTDWTEGGKWTWLIRKLVLFAKDIVLAEMVFLGSNVRLLGSYAYRPLAFLQ